MRLATEVTETENLFETLTNKSPVGLYIVQDGRFCYTNPTFQIATGYREDELLGRDSLELVVPEDRERVRENAIKMLKGELTSPYQFRVTHKNGSIKWVMESVTSVQYLGRRATLGNFVDITEHKRVEEALREAEEDKSASLEEAPISIMHTDIKGKITYINKRFESESGYSREEIVGKNGFKMDLVPAGTIKYLTKRMASRLRGRPGKHWETQFKCKDGRWIWVELEGKVLRKSGVPVGFQIIASNITERKRAEDSLQAEKNKLQSLIDAIDYTITIQDTDYNIIYQNESSKIASGGDHLGEKCYRAYEGRETVCDGCPVEEAFKDGKPHTAERMTTIAGKVAFWENTANPIRNAEGKIVSCLELARDITTRKKQEQALADEATRRRLLIDQSLDGIVVLDEDAKVVEANQRFADMLGYTLEEVHELHTWDWDKQFPPEKLLEMGRGIDEKGLHLETKHTRKDGSAIDVDISISAAMFGGQKLIFCVCRDITERKQAEEALQAEKNKLQSLVDAMEDGLTIQDKDYNIIYQGRLQRSIVGDHLGEKCYRVYASIDTVCPRCPVEKAFKDGKSHTAERSMVLPSGEVTFWENTANPIRDARGEIASCLEINRNITERKKQEQALADELAQRRLLIDKSLDGITVLDEDANVVEANQRFADMLGYTLEEVYKLHTWDWDKQFPPEELLEMGRNVDEKGLHLETKHTRKDGAVIDVDISISKIKYRGQNLIFCIGRDITERKRTEEALKESEQSYRELADSITEVFFAMDEHLRYIYWNKASEILTGIRAEDALGKSLLEVFPDTPGTRRAEKVYRAVLRKQQPQTFVNEFNIDGRHYIFEISAYPSRGGISVFVRDISERKRAEEALRQSEENYRALFDSAVIGTIVIDAETMKLVMANQAAAEMLGFSFGEELIGVDALAFIPPEDKESVGELMVKDLFEQDLRQTHEFRMITQDGREIWISANAARVKHEGRLAGLASFTDITERKKMEEAIKQAAEEWRKTFDSITDAISIHDRDHKILRVNKAFADIFHKKPSQILGRYCYELHKMNKPLSGCPHQQTLATKKPAEAEFYEASLGKYLHESTSPIFNERGEVVGTVHITRDITEQKQQNERLMMADRLASIGELAAGTAHELNNPLTSVIGFSQLLLERDIPDDIREDVELIYNEAQRAANVTKSLLTFGRKHAPIKHFNQINTIIEDVLKLRAYEHKINGIEVQRQLAPDLPEIRVDYFQMQQLLLNIILNAEYFMAEAHNRGTLTITTKKQNSNVRISIADDGPGIPPENLHRIFNPFFTTKEAGKGTGLGLSICHGIVYEHGGHIYAKNQQGKGAIVFVELPINSH